MARTSKLTLGSGARDTVSGWTGTLEARTEYMNGCVRWTIGGADKDGKPEAFAFDEEQIELVGESAPVREPRQTGGPRDHTPPAQRP